MIELENLYLINNQIKEIETEAFKDLVKLKMLPLFFNQIEKIVSGAFKGLEILEILYLHNNSIKEISSGSFKDLTKLKTLNLYYNQIEKIPSDAFEGIKQIEVISFGLTKLKIFKNNIPCLVFRLQQNQIFERKSFSFFYKHDNLFERKCVCQSKLFNQIRTCSFD